MLLARAALLLGLLACFLALVDSAPIFLADGHAVEVTMMNDTHKRASSQFIMTGYQSTSFRSDDCNISIPGNPNPFVLTIVNWYAMYWGFEGKKSEKMHMVIEAETRGWVGVAFAGTSMESKSTPDAVIGWVRKSDAGARYDTAHIGSYRLDFNRWANPTDNSKKVPLENASVCQTRDGRTILRFTRSTRAGKYHINPLPGEYQSVLAAVGKHDAISAPLESAMISWTPAQDKIDFDDNDRFWETLYSNVLIIFHVFSWLLR